MTCVLVWSGLKAIFHSSHYSTRYKFANLANSQDNFQQIFLARRVASTLHRVNNMVAALNRHYLLILCLIWHRRRRSKYLKRFWVRAIFLRRKSSSNSLKKWEEKTTRVSSLISSGCFLIILTTSWHSLLTLQFFSSDQLKETFTFSLLFAAIFVSTSIAWLLQAFSLAGDDLLARSGRRDWIYFTSLRVFASSLRVTRKRS